MPIHLATLEEIDILTEIQSPEFVYSIESTEERIIFSKYINSLPEKRIILLNLGLFNLPFVIAGLKESHVESIIKDEALVVKKYIFTNLSDTEFLKNVLEFSSELDRREKTTENTTRIKNLLQYLKDNKNII